MGPSPEVLFTVLLPDSTPVRLFVIPLSLPKQIPSKSERSTVDERTGSHCGYYVWVNFFSLVDQSFIGLLPTSQGCIGFFLRDQR